MSTPKFIQALAAWFKNGDNDINGLLYVHPSGDAAKIAALVPTWTSMDLVRCTPNSVIACIDVDYQRMRGPEQKLTAIHVHVDGTTIRWGVRRVSTQ